MGSSIPFSLSQFFSSNTILFLFSDGDRYIAWFGNHILLFDENGRILDFYLLEGTVNDIGLSDNTIYIISSPWQHWNTSVRVEKAVASPIPIGIKAVKKKLEVDSLECYSKYWEKNEYLDHNLTRDLD